MSVFGARPFVTAHVELSGKGAQTDVMPPRRERLRRLLLGWQFRMTVHDQMFPPSRQRRTSSGGQVQSLRPAGAPPARPGGRPRGLTVKLLRALGLMVFVSLLSGCVETEEKLRDSARKKRLMAMAAEEAQAVDDPAERLARLLNIANMQITGRHVLDGRRTLGHARATIEAAEEGALDTRSRLAGWISISELGRLAGYTRFAKAGCKEAIGLLRSIGPARDRCDYVRGVAQEVRKLRGKQAAAELLRESAEWAAEIEDRDRRRRAYLAIASDLFICDDYTGGHNVLRCDGDSKWRSDALTKLARQSVPMKAFGKSVSFSGYYRDEHDR